MRYLAKGGYKKTVRKAEVQIVQGPNGPVETLARAPEIAVFWQFGVTPWERELARERFTFTGLAEGENPVKRLSIYDTDIAARERNWDAKTKAEVERVLDEGQNEFYFRVDEPLALKPWPKYDEARSAPKIAEAVLSLGLDVGGVIAYERENKNRESVIEALVALGNEQESEPLVSA